MIWPKPQEAIRWHLYEPISRNMGWKRLAGRIEAISKTNVDSRTEHRHGIWTKNYFEMASRLLFEFIPNRITLSSNGEPASSNIDSGSMGRYSPATAQSTISLSLRPAVAAFLTPCQVRMKIMGVHISPAAAMNDIVDKHHVLVLSGYAHRARKVLSKILTPFISASQELVGPSTRLPQITRLFT